MESGGVPGDGRSTVTFSVRSGGCTETLVTVVVLYGVSLTHSWSGSRYFVFVTSTMAGTPDAVITANPENRASATSSKTTAGLSSLTLYFKLTPVILSPLTCLA